MRGCVPLDSFAIICSNLERHYFWLGTDSFAKFYFSIFNKKFISIFRWRIWFISYIIWRYISRLFKDNTIAQWRHLEITFIGRHGRVANKNLRFNGLKPPAEKLNAFYLTELFTISAGRICSDTFYFNRKNYSTLASGI